MRRENTRHLIGLMGGATAMAVVSIAWADGAVIDRIYNPYVQPLEREIEMRSLFQNDDRQEDFDEVLLGVGRSLSERVSVEVYAIGSRTSGQDFSPDAAEVELKWQLTEQGEFAFDLGMLFELEREFEDNVWEASTSVLINRDLGRWTASANLDFIYEWGGGIDNELDTSLHLQTRYRLKEAFEPAIEFHAGEDTLAAGPVMTGLFRFSSGRKFRWSAGYFTGLDSISPDSTVRITIEYEF
ncbi:MAG: hypothetical protein AB8B96_00115 [Lysobacterales bacterium]